MSAGGPLSLSSPACEQVFDRDLFGVCFEAEQHAVAQRRQQAGVDVLLDHGRPAGEQRAGLRAQEDRLTGARAGAVAHEPLRGLVTRRVVRVGRDDERGDVLYEVGADQDLADQLL